MEKNFGYILDFLSKLNLIKLISSFVVTMILFWINYIPNYVNLPFKDFNVYFMFTAILFAVFLLIVFIENIIKMIRTHINESDLIEQRNNEAFDRLYAQMDSLASDGIQFVVQQLNNGNQTFYFFGYINFDNFFNSNMIYRFTCIDESVKNKLLKEGNYYPNGIDFQEVYGYQLKKELYSMLVYTYKKTGKISNSNREKDLIKINGKD